MNQVSKICCSIAVIRYLYLPGCAVVKPCCYLSSLTPFFSIGKTEPYFLAISQYMIKATPGDYWPQSSKTRILDGDKIKSGLTTMYGWVILPFHRYAVGRNRILVKICSQRLSTSLSLVNEECTEPSSVRKLSRMKGYSIDPATPY